MATESAFPLCPVDYIFCEKQQYSMTFVLDFEQQQDFDALRESLAAALQRFYPIKGRLVLNDKDEYEIIDDVGGPFGPVSFELREAKAPGSDDALALLDYAVPIDAQLGNPISRFVLTNTPRGSMLSASIAHAVADGFSYFLFLASWAALTRRAEFPLPAHVRELLNWKGEDYGDLSPSSVLRATGYSLLDRKFPPTPLDGYASLKWSDAELANYRAEAARELDTKLSDHEMLCALLLKDCATRWHKPSDRIRMHSPLDFRRFVPEVTPLFFGNGTRGVPFEESCQEILGLSVAALALRVKAAIAEVGRPQIDDHLRANHGLKATGGVALTRKLHSWHPEFGLLATNLTRMPLAQVDFGRGAPRQVCPIGSPRAYVMLRRQGAIEALVGLPAAGSPTAVKPS